MASLYKKPVIMTDPNTGERVKTKSLKWWGRFRDYSGREKRVPLARDKTSALTMLNERVQKEELKAAGRIDPFEDEGKRPIGEHIDQFEAHLQHKGNTAQHIHEVATKVRKIAKGRKWKFIRDISASQTMSHLADLRSKDGLSIQTSNHYLRAIKQFSRWLVRDRRMREDPLVHLSMLNVCVRSANCRVVGLVVEGSAGVGFRRMAGARRRPRLARYRAGTGRVAASASG